MSVDTLLSWLLRFVAALVGAVVLLVVVYLLVESFPAFRAIGLTRFFTDDTWHPTEGQYNFVPMLWGTILSMLGALFLATPSALLSAIFCHFYAPPRLAALYRRMLELLGGIPSVVYGLFGLMVVVPLIGSLHAPGTSLLSAIIILSIMILPTIALLADAALSNVPEQYIRAAAALGLSRWATISGVVLPSARSGLFTGVILGAARAIGETMAILMVAGNVVQAPTSLFAPMRTLTANIALEMAYAQNEHRSALFVGGLFLVGMITFLVFLVERMRTGRIYA